MHMHIRLLLILFVSVVYYTHDLKLVQYKYLNSLNGNVQYDHVLSRKIM